MKTLNLTQPHDAAQLMDELTAAVPGFLRTSIRDGERVADADSGRVESDVVEEALKDATARIPQDMEAAEPKAKAGAADDNG